MNVIEESRRALETLEWEGVGRTITAIQQADRVFCVGNGGGYAHAMHLASDLRKIAAVQAFSFDNVAEMTARVNDDGWEDAWVEWLESHGYNAEFDLRFMFSVGGGIDGYSRNLPFTPWGIGGSESGLSVRIPSTSTPVIEGCQSVIAHHIVEQLG